MYPEDLTTVDFATATVDDLAHRFGRSEAWGAGLLDGATGDQDWSLTLDDHEITPTRAELDDYRAGYCAGRDALEYRAAAGPPRAA